MIDRTTKLLLAAIAVGLFANAIVHLLPIAPALAEVSVYDSSNISSMAHDIHGLFNGTCTNSRLC